MDVLMLYCWTGVLMYTSIEFSFIVVEVRVASCVTNLFEFVTLFPASRVGLSLTLKPCLNPLT
jgi:uncharacterized protein (DUF486 family)